MTAKRALITGITGQDGSYLAEHLLELGYEVHGLVRRVSQPNFTNLAGVIDKVTLHTGDMTDGPSLFRIVRDVAPDEIYNLAAMSQVRDSYDHPEVTQDINAGGLLRIMEACRTLGLNAKIYNACSSEMFGKVRETPQTELTAFYPRSPYGASKVAAFNHARCWREAYGTRVYCGILFNHECITAQTPLIVRRNGTVDVVTIREIVPLRQKGATVQTFTLPGVEVWDGESWAEIRAITGTKRRAADADHDIISVEARGGIVEATAHHRMIAADGTEMRADEVREGDRLKVGALPDLPEWAITTPEMAEFLGLMTADGYVPEFRHALQFTNNDHKVAGRVAHLWRALFLGDAQQRSGPSGFDSSKSVGQLYLNGRAEVCEQLRRQLYGRDGEKRVPTLILNASAEVRRAYLMGYYAGDGLKAGGATRSRRIAQSSLKD
jgi:GDPmannose 4,6-dehydratase